MRSTGMRSPREHFLYELKGGLRHTGDHCGRPPSSAVLGSPRRSCHKIDTVTSSRKVLLLAVALCGGFLVLAAKYLVWSHGYHGAAAFTVTVFGPLTVVIVLLLIKRAWS